MNRFSRWQKVVLGIGLAALVGIPVALASGPHGRGGWGGPRFMKHMLSARIEDAEDYIDATPAQRQVIEAAKDSVLAKLEARRAAHAGQREKWIALLKADRLDTAAIYAEVDRRADELKAAARELVPEIEKVHAALTPAQREKLAARAEKMHRRWAGPEE